MTLRRAHRGALSVATYYTPQSDRGHISHLYDFMSHLERKVTNCQRVRYALYLQRSPSTKIPPRRADHLRVNGHASLMVYQLLSIVASMTLRICVLTNQLARM